MDESFRNAHPNYGHSFLGREDADGLKYHLEYPDGNFEKMWLNQTPEADMVDIRTIRLHETFDVQNNPNLQAEINKIRKVERETSKAFIAQEKAGQEVRMKRQEQDQAAARKAVPFVDCADYVNANPFPASEDWWRQMTFDIRQEWTRLAGLAPPGLKESGMPPPISAMVEGRMKQLELEITNYLKLAGIRYVTTKGKLEKEALELRRILGQVGSRIDRLIATYKALQSE